MRLETEVPWRINHARSAPKVSAASFSAAPAAPSWEDGLPGSLPESDISANMAISQSG